jgi:hypothetical protein
MRWLTFLFIPAFAIAGAANAQHEWLGALSGAMVGLFFACLFSGVLPSRMVSWMFPRHEKEPLQKE